MRNTESQVAPPTGLVTTTDRKPVPLLGVGIDCQVQGLLCEWRVSQRFRNDETKPIEALYIFPLPEDATVCGLKIRIGAKVLVGEVEDRETAFERYDQAMESGDGAFLLDQERPDYFQMSVGALLPREEAVVEIRLINLLKPSGKAFRLMFPTTVSPRYGPESATPAETAEFERITPEYATEVPYGFTLNVEAHMNSAIRSVESPSHPLRTEVRGKKASIALGQREAALDRDIVILIETAQPRDPALLAGSWKGRDYLLLELYPDLGEADGHSKEVCFLVDCSGSMDGPSIEEARRALELCVRGLNVGDLFQIVRFGSHSEKLFPAPLVFGQETLDRAVPLIRGMRADLGGTETLKALQGIQADRDRRSAPRPAEGQTTGPETSGAPLTLILLTDGQAFDEKGILAWAHEHRSSLRVFSFGIGAGASAFLVEGIARQTGGAAEFIFPGERIEPKVLKQFARLSTPILADLALDWGVSPLDQAPATIPPVFSGSAFLVSARLPAKAKAKKGAKATLSGTVGRKTHRWAAGTSPCKNGEALALWWARLMIRDLEEHPEQLLAGSNQRGRRGESRISQLSREFGVVSSETSYVAVEERAEGAQSTERAELRKVPVQITTGWHGMKKVIPAPTGASTPTGGAAQARLFSLAPPVAATPSLGGVIIGALRDAARAITGGGGEEIRYRLAEYSQDSGAPPESRCRESSPRPPAAPPKPASPTSSSLPWVFEVLAEMRADGSFALTPLIVRVSGHPRETLEGWARRIETTKAADRGEILVTAMVIVLLRARAAPDEDTWKLAVGKAERWLESCAATGPGRQGLLAWVGGLLGEAPAQASGKY